MPKPRVRAFRASPKERAAWPSITPSGPATWLLRTKAMSDQLQKLSELSERQAEEAELLSQTKREDFAQSDIRLRKAAEGTRDLAKLVISGIENG